MVLDFNLPSLRCFVVGAVPSSPYPATVAHREDNLDEDGGGPNKRKSKKKHVRRRSGMKFNLHLVFNLFNA